MPFKQVFERRVIEEMQDGEAGPAPRSPTPPRSTSLDDSDIKKQPFSPEAQSTYETEDLDFSSKGEKTLPPRFSTLFETSKAAPLSPPTPRIVECCHRESMRRGGIYLSTPVFVLLVIVLLFESTLLFAYTVIGLYQNLPSGLLAVAGAPVPAPVDGCHCEAADRQGTINFSPNFVFGEGGGSLVGPPPTIESVTMHESSSLPTTAATSTSATLHTSQSTSTTSTTSDTSEAAAAAASQILSLFGNGKHTSSTSPKVSIVTETPGVVRSTVVVTSSAGPTDTDTAARPTVTSVQIVDGPATTIQARSPTSTSGTVGAVEEATETAAATAATAVAGGEGGDGGSNGDAGAEDAAPNGDGESASGPKHTAGPCFGGSGAVMLNCI